MLWGREMRVVSVDCCCVVVVGAVLVFLNAVCGYAVQVTQVDYAAVRHCGVSVGVAGFVVLGQVGG